MNMKERKTDRRLWTSAEERILRKLYPDPTVSIASIAAEIGRTEIGVASHANEIGLTRPRKVEVDDGLLNRLYRRGMTIDELAAKFGITKWTVKRYIV